MTKIVTLAKDQRERLVFKIFATAAGLLDATARFESRPTPEPDILLHANQLGPQAFELVEIVDQGLQGSIGLQLNTKTVCHEYLDSLPPTEQVDFCAKYSNANIGFEFRPGFSLQRRRNFLPHLFSALNSLPDGLVGELSTHDLGLSKTLSFLNVYRGRIVGPMFDAGSAVWVGDPTVDAIFGKTKKNYVTPHPLNLLAYIDSHPMFPDDVWLPDLDDYLSSLDVTCQFERIYVFNCRTKTVERIWRRNA